MSWTREKGVIELSYSAINNCLQPNNSHNWVNKMMGIKVPDSIYFSRGRDGHRIVQDHVAGIKEDVRLSEIKYKFPIVEREDFDDNCKIRFKINEKYALQGFFDGANFDDRASLEIKTGGKLWTLGQFQKSKQRVIYAIGEPRFTKNILVSVHFDPDTWDRETAKAKFKEFVQPKVFTIPVTQQDKDEVWQWILNGIKVLESGDYVGGLNEDGKCTNPYCYYGQNCMFK